MTAARALGIVAALALSGPAAADDLSAEAFERMTTGKTLEFTQDGTPYGAEFYGPDRQVTWQFSNGACEHGQWFADGDALCFTYEANPSVQCWRFARRGETFFARVADLPEGDPSELKVSRMSRRALACPGPDLGV